MKCPVCNNNTFPENDYEFKICDECFFEYDPIQVNNPDYSGGANKSSLNEYKKLYEKLKKEKTNFSCKNDEDKDLIIRLDQETIEKIARNTNPNDIVESCNEHKKEYEEFLKSEFKELDRVKDKNGRTGTIMAIWFDTTGLEVEFDDNAPEIETIDMRDVEKIEEVNKNE